MTNLLSIPESWGERQRSLSREYGRPGAARGLDDMALMAAVESDADSAAARLREFNATGERPVAGRVPLADLLKHMDKHYTEYQLKHDLDCVLSLCAGEADKAEVRRFARAKLAGRVYEGPVALESGICQSCRKPFNPRRSTARFCSATCRSKANRRGMQR